MAERVQLKEPGSELVMTVRQVSATTVENTEYFVFSNGKKELLIPKSSVLSQMERLGAEAPADLANMTIRFSRSTKLSKYGKPYWNLDLATEELSPIETHKPLPIAYSTPLVSAGAPSVEERPKLTKIYLEATEFVLDKIVPLYEKAEIGMSDQAVAACVQTIFIAASKER